MKSHNLILLLILGSVCFSKAQDFLDQIHDYLKVESADSTFRLAASGLIDLEGYAVDEHPPGLLFSSDPLFINPRLTLFLDANLGRYFYAFFQGRADRGFDPGYTKDGDLRPDEYLLRLTPIPDNQDLHIQIGKFATVIGNWIPRHDSWMNPFVTAPIPYENVTILTTQTIPTTPQALLHRKTLPDLKHQWSPVIWGPVYATGVSAFGSVQFVDYAFEVKNSAPAARPQTWEPTENIVENPVFGARVGIRPNEAWNVGWSASLGPYLDRATRRTLPAGTSVDDYQQILIGQDVQYSVGHWQFWSEIYLNRFEMPLIGDADSLSWYLEGKYKITPQWYAAFRWNQQYFGRIDNGAGGDEPWDQDAWKVDVAVGWKTTSRIQWKLQYSHSHQLGPFQQGENLGAAQLTIRF